MSFISRVAVVVCLFVVSFALVSAQSSTFNVNTTTDSVDANLGDGICADADGRCSLRAAIMEANADSNHTKVNLPAGDYITTLTSGLTDESFGDLDITQSIEITGAGADVTFISNGIAGERVMEITQGTDVEWALIYSISVRNGDTSTNGGGLYISSGAHVLLAYVEVINNRAATGGGVWVELASQSFAMSHSSVIENTAVDSCGGLYFGTTGNLGIHTSTIYGNEAENGEGGAICYSESAGNLATPGASIFEVTIAHNSAATVGGGILNRRAEAPRTKQVIMTNNVAGGIGSNCAFRGAATTAIQSNTGNVFDTNGCIGAGASDVITATPIIEGLPEIYAPGHTRTIKLAFGSPAIDIMHCDYAYTDQRGIQRPQGPSCDAGAYEMEQGPAQTYTINSTADTIDTALGDAICADALGNCSLRAALMQANAFGNADTIIIPAGHYVSSLTSGSTDDSYGDFDILQAVVIQGANADETIISSGIAGERVLEVKIDRISPPYSYAPGDSVSLESVGITNGNTPENGGGILIDTGLRVSLLYTEISNNTAANGGGIWTSNSTTFWLRYSSIIQNVAVQSCGGVRLGASISQNLIETSTLAENHANAGEGGAICIDANAVPEYSNVFMSLSIVNNSAGTTGGSIMNRSASEPVVSSSLFVGNSAGVSGANCAFAGEATHTITSYYNLFDLSGCGDAQPEDIITNTPNLGTLALHAPGHTRTVSLHLDSPAVDSTNFMFCEGLDQRSVHRPSGYGCDIGAYEVTAPGVIVFIMDWFTNWPLVTPLHVTEAGATGEFNVSLGSEPQGTVIYTFSDTGGDLSFDPAQIVFTPENWDDWEAGTVTVSAVNDVYVEGLENTEVIVTVSGTAPEYAGVVPRNQITVEITDNDSPQITVAPSMTPLVVGEDGTTASFDVSINSEPTGTVNVTFGGAGSDFALSVPSVEFNAANWQTPVTVTVGATDDGIAEGTKNGAITFTVGGTAAEYAGMTLANLAVTVLDDDSTAINIMPSTLPLSISEDGGTGSFDISLDSEPTGTVTITFSGAGSDFALDLPSVEFDAANWDTLVTVTLSAVDDAEAEGTETTAVTFTVDGTAAEYAGMTHANLPVKIADNDLVTVTEELITNGGWEMGGVTAWKYTSAQAKRQCKGTGNSSHCALLLKPGLPPAVAYQDVPAALVPFEAGETLYFEFAAKVGGTAKLNAILKLKYLDGTRAKLKVRPMPVNTAKSWAVSSLEDSSAALLNLKAIRVQFKHNGGTGKIRVDDAVLQLVSAIVLPRGEINPLPAPPEGFRGGN